MSGDIDVPARTAEDERNRDRYRDAMHAVQSAVALDISVSGYNGAGADAKHLRTGIDACLVDAAAVATLLMQKGVFTQSEYLAALADAAEREREEMTERMRQRTGNPAIHFA